MLDTPTDLTFSPVDHRPEVLSQDHIDAYNRDGFIAPFDVFDGSEIETIRTYADRLMAAMGRDGAYGINCYQARLRGLYDLATEPRILDLVQDIIGPDILCWASAILCKQPGDPKAVPWHQDASFWALSPARTVTVWLAIDDADAENAAMRFIPGSHDKGALAVKASGEEAVFHKETADTTRLGAPVTNALRAGQVSLHADMLVHGSRPNLSNRRRCGLTLRYCPPSVQTTDPTWARGVEALLCRGSAGAWRTHPRPANDDITATGSPHVVGNN
ncbi:syringomycin biosynthesis enzyme [Jannaschia pagri]|uniref:Syringomycin biosynthesis enzyme n=1 Tax=Jannaschia pagri TaxID=2829797 RepID=A0ABQ4NJB5_9RHOB|nr:MULTISPECIES: phytanoyl-CoA dioxygenase family protein [unclassified Jannaschia]GIT90692.1 syringomycin biosynthesis enzyme [Jannaschia sp. AI_61]GIT94524.1 syringomycin biosynthesis enzyme [Jannaschia sp. AI_62]